MKAIELREELRKYIEIGDGNFLKALHETAELYMRQQELYNMIAEGEDDIKNKRLHSQDEVQNMIEEWTKE